MNEKSSKPLWEIILLEAEFRGNQNIHFNTVFEEFQNYLNRYVFPLLKPAMKDMINEMGRTSVLRNSKVHFNGLDYLAEILWNRNPRYPQRADEWLVVYNIPKLKLWLNTKPRIRKPWLCSKKEAAIFIQKHIRGWLIRKRDDVQEMRQFWRDISYDTRLDNGYSIHLGDQVF